MDFLNQLNPSQREAVTHTEGPSLIVAGAGSGKTRVLTYRIAYLLSQGVPAGQIMALTFTNKAAREMKERIEKLVEPQAARYLWMGTFHSICSRLLRREAERLGFTHDFTIYDTQDSKSLIKAICKERGLDEKIYKPATVLGRISMAKNNMISPAKYGMHQDLMRQDREIRLYEMPVLYELYQTHLRAANAMDFDDLLINMLQLMNTFPEVEQQWQAQFRYLLVDEYQDTNYVQYLLVSRLAEPQRNICVVGDDAQSIYSFRGADIRNILNFQRQYPQAALYKLERNYRSTQMIVNAANSLIHQNRNQIHKDVYSENETGHPLVLRPYMDDRAEAEGVVRQIAKSSHRSHYDDVAVLYRTNAQSRAFEGELRKQGIPYRIYGGTSFYQRKEVKDVLSFFRLAINPRDNEALKRAVDLAGKGIGDTTMKRVALNAVENHRSYMDVMRNPADTQLEVSTATQRKIQAFAQTIDELGMQSDQMDAYQFATYVVHEMGILTLLALDRTQEGIDRKQNVEELLNAIQEFVLGRQNEGIDYTPISDFLSEVSLLTDQDENLQDATARVTLMTVHAAKGLEFPIVFVAGLEEDLFPSQFCTSASEIEEERRLLYVAITRAKQECFLSYARQRFRNGQVVFSNPSRFLNDIDRQYVEVEKPASPTWTPSFSRSYDMPRFRATEEPKPIAATPVTNQQSTIASSAWKQGDRVSHRVFGEGTVMRVYRDEVTENDKIEIDFDKVGTKTLLLTHAKLDRV